MISTDVLRAQRIIGFFIVVIFIFSLLLLFFLPPDGVKLRVSADHQKTQTINVDQPGKVTCAFDGKPIMITWHNMALSRLPDRMIPRKDRLHISKVRFGDRGKYQCKAYDGFSVAEAMVEVKVEGKLFQLNFVVFRRIS